MRANYSRDRNELNQVVRLAILWRSVNFKLFLWCLHFLPKNKLTSSKVEFVRSFFGRNVGLKKSFLIYLTFRDFILRIELKTFRISLRKFPVSVSSKLTPMNAKWCLQPFTVLFTNSTQTKGQLILKCLCGKFSQKSNKKIQLYYWGIQAELFSFVLLKN